MENYSQQPATPQSPVPQNYTVPVKPAPKKPSISIGRFLMYAVLIAAGAAISKFAFDYLTPKLSPKTAPSLRQNPVTAVPRPSKSAPIASPLETVQQTIKAVANPKAFSPRAVIPFELNGIYLSGSDRCALINNKIVQEGEDVDGAIVTRIGEEEVEISRDGKTIKLTTKN